MSQPVPRAYKPWLILAVILFVGSLFLLATMVTLAFVLYSESQTPLWITLLGVVAVLGIGLSFVLAVLLMSLAGWRSFRESRRVQILPPEHQTSSTRMP